MNRWIDMRRNVPLIVYAQLLVILFIEQLTGNSGKFARR